MQASGATRAIHLAALLGKRSDENPLRSLKVNVESVINVFEAALSLGIERVVWASSVGVYGSRHQRSETGALANDAPHTPSTLYGATKSFAERVALHYRRTRGLNAVGLRFVLVYGYGKDRTIARGTGADFTSDLIDKPALGLPGRVPAGGAIIDFLDIEDAARSVLLAADAAPGRSVALNITGYRATLAEAAAISRRLMPKADITVEDGDWNGTDHHYDGAAARAEIGYAPTIPIEEGFRRNIAEVRRRHVGTR
jgi:UDP-glucose 4-epimerase